MASRTALIGALGLGKQSAKGSVASSIAYIPATSINLNAAQQTQTLPPEIGGSYFLRGSYKSGVSTSGDASLVVRPQSLGYLLDMLCGAHTESSNHANQITPPAGAPTLGTAGTGGTIAAGTYTVAFTWVDANGETPASPTASQVTTGATSTLTITVPATPAGATGWNAYVSAAGIASPLYKQNGTTLTGTSTTLTSLTQTGGQPPSVNTTGPLDGSYTHVFNPFAPAAGADLPWYSAIKDVGKLYYEQFVDTKLNSLRFDVSKQQIVTTQASFFGLTPSEIAAPTETAPDSSQYFAACSATVTLTDEANVLTFPAAATQFERVSFDFNNNLSQDEFIVGSFYAVDSSLLQRTATISLDVVLRDPALVRAVYRAGGTSAWSPKIVRGALTLLLQSSDNIPGTSRPYSLQITIPGMDFLMMPVPMQGAQLIRANLSAQITLGPSGTDQFSFNLVNTLASY